MSTTINISPTTTAHQYWRDTSWTQTSPYTRSFAGTTSYTYLWPIPFDLSAYSSKQLVTLKLYVKFSSASNTFSAGEHLDVGYTTSNSSSSAAAAATLLDSLLPVDDTWCEFDISSAWTTLIAGTTYLVLSANEYAVLYNNYTTVAEADRPYIELVYNEGTINYGTGGAWDECLVYYGSGGTWHLVTPYYGSGGTWHEIGGQ